MTNLTKEVKKCKKKKISARNSRKPFISKTRPQVLKKKSPASVARKRSLTTKKASTAPNAGSTSRPQAPNKYQLAYSFAIIPYAPENRVVRMAQIADPNDGSKQVYNLATIASDPFSIDGMDVETIRAIRSLGHMVKIMKGCKEIEISAQC